LIVDYFILQSNIYKMPRVQYNNTGYLHAVSNKISSLHKERGW